VELRKAEDHSFTPEAASKDVHPPNVGSAGCISGASPDSEPVPAEELYTWKTLDAMNERVTMAAGLPQLLVDLAQGLLYEESDPHNATPTRNVEEEETDLADTPPPEDIKRCGQDEADAILAGIRAIEARCMRDSLSSTLTSSDVADAEDMEVECVLDQPDARYCLCNSPESPIIICHMTARLPDLEVQHAINALWNADERLVWDPDSKFSVLRPAQEGDKWCKEVVTFEVSLPWPFWNREVLQNRWKMPLNDGPGNGFAVIMRSFEDAEILPVTGDRLRAFVHKAAYLLRPLRRWDADDSQPSGLELTYCSQVDIGGLVPQWAQNFARRALPEKTLGFVRKMQAYCLQKHPTQLPVRLPTTATTLPELERANSGPSPAARKDAQMQKTGAQVLAELTSIERCCCARGWAADTCVPQTLGSADCTELWEESSLEVEVLLDTPHTRYCLCHSPESSVVTCYLWTQLPRVCLEDALLALCSGEERLQWDSDSGFNVVREAREDDPTCEEVVYYTLQGPWPFWDRDVLQNRWQLPLNGPDGRSRAVIMRSLEDESIMPVHEDKVRAFVHKAGYFLRPLRQQKTSLTGNATWKDLGVELTACSQIDIGGIIPQWAQAFLSRISAQRVVGWTEDLQEHCMRINDRRLGVSNLNGQDSDADCDIPVLTHTEITGM